MVNKWDTKKNLLIWFIKTEMNQINYWYERGQIWGLVWWVLSKFRLTPRAKNDFKSYMEWISYSA